MHGVQHMSLSPAFPYKAALAVAVVAGTAFFFYARRAAAEGKSVAQSLGEQAGAAVVGAVEGVTTGVVLGVGDAVGIPRTNETECERALREGGWKGNWDASFACPAGTFLKSVFSW